jgi:mandelamide amidase
MVNQGGEPGPFWGVADALKDFLPTKGKVTTPGSEALRDWVPTEDSPVVERLGQAGGILLGNTTSSKLAHAARPTGARSTRLPVRSCPNPPRGGT